MSEVKVRWPSKTQKNGATVQSIESGEMAEGDGRGTGGREGRGLLDGFLIHQRGRRETGRVRSVRGHIPSTESRNTTTMNSRSDSDQQQ
jgi:hypothetical protein